MYRTVLKWKKMDNVVGEHCVSVLGRSPTPLPSPIEASGDITI
jgi:hypothetical protein